MGKAHQNIAGQMKSELEEPLAAFAGGMKERRKIVQTGIEKLLKVKTQQTAAVNKARDKYEQDCLKIKGYLAQGHMVMGQEERKNKAKLEKTQTQLSSTSQDYEGTIKVLEETTGRWNRDWKAACDKFQDLEEERIDFTKSSLWTFANIASTVCVSDDGSCEKIRLSLEDCDVEKDITTFIKDTGTGQEIPDPPKYIDFCRGDVNDTTSEASEEGAYTVAQFPRPINPAIRSSSPQPSVFESHHDPNSALARDFGRKGSQQEVAQDISQLPSQRANSGQQIHGRGPNPYQQGDFGDIPQVPHDPYPMDGMTQFCRTAPPLGPPSERSSATSPVRPSSRDSQSEYSNPTSFSSFEPTSGAQSPVKQMGPPVLAPSEDEASPTKKRSFFNSPFSRRNKSEKDLPSANAAANRNTWAPSRNGNRGIILPNSQGSVSPEPIDPRANFQLNVGNNVFDVATPDTRRKPDNVQQTEMDPIAQALEELKGVTKAGSLRVSADRYVGLATPAPPGTLGSTATPTGGIATPLANGALSAAQRGTPPPSYDNPGSRLGAPPAAHTARAMQETTRKYIDQKQNMFSPGQNRGSHSRPPTRGNSGSDVMRATSPAPPRAVSPRPGFYNGQQQGNYRPPSQAGYRPPSQAGFSRAASPNPYAAPPNGRPRANTNIPAKQGPPSAYGGYSSRGGSPNAPTIPRAVSPNPQFGAQSRPGSSRGGPGGDMTLQLAGGGSHHGRPGSYYGGQGPGQEGAVAKRTRSKSVAEPRNYTADGRAILHYGESNFSLPFSCV